MRKFYEIHYIDAKDNKNKTIRYYCKSEEDAMRLFNNERINLKEITSIDEFDAYQTP